MLPARSPESREKEAVLRPVGEDTAPVVPSKDDVVGMLRKNDEASGFSWHACFLDRSRGVVAKNAHYGL